MESFIQRHKKSLLHIAFWCVYASFFFYQISFNKGGGEPDWARISKDFTFHMIAMIGISYLNYFFFLPRLLRSRNFGRYILEFLPVFCVLAYLVVVGKRFILADYIPTHWLYSTRFTVNVILGALFLAVFVGLLKFVEDWFELEARKKELENKSLSSELRFLKAQINPHFLFNTLNNLYYLAYTKSPNTTEVISKLSQMMRYMLDDSNHSRVSLSKEIEYMQNYVSLEQLRLGEHVPIRFEVQGDISGVTIAPLVLITFLENAFKHGVSNSSSDSWIDVLIQVKGKMCNYRVANSKIPESGKTVKKKSGIGLQNVKRRLELSYPDKYQLKVESLEDRYSVELKLNLE
ncbi:MAG: histidine kinase [Phaeodactylibacter sp.]|nr:histidine kinase [Phaeodactylibacter sp.]MCB9265723.1 histidine kinase [Lewinellaceae bacterium]MCB9285800.1 histidine kinase [Lewinellaceae bacterium]